MTEYFGEEGYVEMIEDILEAHLAGWRAGRIVDAEGCHVVIVVALFLI